MAWLRDVFSTASSFVIPLVSPFIMHRCMSGTVHATIETPMLRSLRTGSFGPTIQQGYCESSRPLSGVLVINENDCGLTILGEIRMQD
jgi:hypothetical protein